MESTYQIMINEMRVNVMHIITSLLIDILKKCFGAIWDKAMLVDLNEIDYGNHEYKKE